MTAVKRIPFCLLALALSPVVALAAPGLSWDKESVELHPPVGAQQAVAVFEYTNQTNAPLTVESAQPSCPCTAAELDKSRLALGETGHLKATFTIGNRRGLHEQSITVRVQGEKEASVLTMKIEIPEALRIEPKLVYWNVSDPVESREVMLTPVEGTGLKLRTASSSNPEIEATLGPETEGRYRLTVRPRQLAATGIAVITLEAVSGEKFQVYAQIRSAVPAQ